DTSPSGFASLIPGASRPLFHSCEATLTAAELSKNKPAPEVREKSILQTPSVVARGEIRSVGPFRRDRMTWSTSRGDRLMSDPNPVVGILMGSQSDWETMKNAADTLKQLQVPHEVRVLSAHRTHEAFRAYVSTAESRGLKILIGGAGGAAHLPGVAA